MILSPDSSGVHNIPQLPESTTNQMTDLSGLSANQREPALNLGTIILRNNPIPIIHIQLLAIITSTKSGIEK